MFAGVIDTPLIGFIYGKTEIIANLISPKNKFIVGDELKFFI